LSDYSNTLPATAASTAPARLVLVLGGARSGKSTFAERLAAESGRSIAFIATATPADEDMRQRIARHRAARPRSWSTIEEPLKLAAAVRRAAEFADILLLDCLTLWLANWLGQQAEVNSEQDAGSLMLADAYGKGALRDIEELLAAVAALSARKTLIVVSNEVGMGIVPAYALGRIYRDILGWINQRVAREADLVYLMVAGLGVDIKRLHEEAAL
jgi:adenosylcobinamide kinase/adenosylcobinamide-phosphate guanylyltransferase